MDQASTYKMELNRR